MRKSSLPALLALSALALVILGGCDVLTNNKTGNTISGTISANWDPGLTTPLVLTISNGSAAYTTEVSVIVGQSGIIASYSIAGVPAGTYTITATYTCASPPYSPIYFIDGVQAQSPPISTANGNNGQYYDVTDSVVGLTISGSETIDIDLGNLG